MLTRKMQGHCAYYGITGNSAALNEFAFHVTRIWKKWLNRRSQRKSMPWERLVRLLNRYPLPRMLAIHSVLRA